MNPLFPVLALNNNITQLINKNISADISENIKKGLNNEIHFIDQDCPISDIAQIAKSSIDERSHVTLSAAYCQYLWLICSLIIREIDLSVITEECEQSGISLEQIFEEISKKARYKSKDVHTKQCTDFLKQLLELKNKTEFQNQQEYHMNLLHELTGGKPFNLDDFSKINLNSFYGEKVNSVYCFGICFILLHEASHFSLGHMNTKNYAIEDEVNADSSSFWNIYSDDKSETEKFSAGCGVLCALFSLLYLNPTIESDNIHPAEDDRIFEVYDLIKEDNPKYTVLLVQLFRYWADLHQIAGFPNDLQNTEESVDKIKCFLAEYKKQNNKCY